MSATPKNNHQSGISNTAILLAILLAIIAFFLALIYLPGEDSPQNTDIDTSSWVTYTNEQYSFSLLHPQDWEVATGTRVVAPIISIYKPGSTTSTPPFDHFANATHASVYPQGIPTEGEIGATATSSLALGYNAELKLDYLLFDDKAWASYINPANEPPSWNQAGFLWAKVSLTDTETYCLNTSTQERAVLNECLEIPKNENRTLVREGQINQRDRAIQEEILKSFQWEAVQAPISVTSPVANQTVSSPLAVTGSARGTWYFEAVFPVELKDQNGNVIAQTNAQATEDWMTEDFVPFEATLTFTPPASGTTGMLILKKDNPSGLPQNAAEVTIPVQF